MSAAAMVAAAAVIAGGIAVGASVASAASEGATASSVPDFGSYAGPRMVQLSDGSDGQVLGIDEDGRLWGWGVNTSRQVTGTSTTATPTPTEITAVTDLLDDGERIVQLAGGYVTSYALTSQGRVISWGADRSYSLGRNTSAAAPGFVLVDAATQLTGIVQIDSGHSHVLALDASGKVWGWGLNNWAQLGLGSTANQRYAVQNPHLSEVTEVSAGYTHSAAIVDGRVKAWGNNSGNLAVGSSVSRVSTPADVVTTSGMTEEIVSVAAGYTPSGVYTYAVDRNGQVWSWGTVQYNRLGRDGTRNLPGRVLDAAGNALSGIILVKAGHSNGYALASDGTAYSWGQNVHGALGLDHRTHVNRATKIRNFDLDAGEYGSELSGIESIWTGWHHIGIISTVAGHEGVVSVSGHADRTGQSQRVSVLVPNLVWKFEHSFKELPLTLVPRDGKTYPNRVVSEENLVQRDPGTLNYGVEPFELRETTAESTAEVSIPVRYALNGYCSLNQTTSVVTVNNGGYCDITRSFAGNALVQAIPTESWRVFTGKAIQDIAALGTTAAPGELLQGLDTDSAPIALPNTTDAPLSQGALVYRVTQGNPDVCQLSAYDGVRTNSQRYLQALGEGLCELEVTQSGNTRIEAMTKIVQFGIGAGRQVQSLDLTGLDGIRYHASEQTHSLPATTTVGGEPVSYSVLSGPCTVSGSTLTATGAGVCMLSMTAPAGDGGPSGYLPYADARGIVIAKGIQSLDMAGVFDELRVATSTSEELPTATGQGLGLSNWAAEAAPGETAEDVCSISAGRVLAGLDAPVEDGDAPVDCLVTASNPGNADYEPYSFHSVVTIDPRDMQSVDLAVLDGKKFGDAPFVLPATTDQGVGLSYSASGSCQVDGTEVTILSGGDCLITASAPGTVGVDGDPSYRPFSVVKTAPIAAIGQYVNGMPALNTLKVGSVSGALPAQTAQGKPVSWATTTPTVCELVADADGGRERVRILGDGECSITGSAPGDASYAAYAFELGFQAAINYDGLDAEIAAAIGSNDDGAGNPRYTADTWAAYRAALLAAEEAQEPNGVSQANVDGLQEALADAKAELVDLSELREAYESRVTDASPYTPASWAAYQDAVADALEVLINDADATAAEVTAAAEALYDATGELVLLADTAALQAEADEVNALTGSDYVATGWADLQASLSAAEAVLADPNATQAEVDDALAALQAAKDALVDVSLLAAEVEMAQLADRQEGDYSSESWADYLDALSAAEAVLSNADATQAEVDDALLALKDASGALAWASQLVPPLVAAISGHAVGDAPVELPASTDRGAEVSYEIDAASADICQLVEGRLLLVGFGDCIVNWTAPAIGDFPASTGSEQAPTAPGIQLLADGMQLLEGDRVDAGQALTARGGGLEPGSAVIVELRPGSTVLATAVVAADGTVSVDFIIPDGIRPGAYTVHAQGVSELDGSALIRTAEVAVQNLAFTGGELLALLGGGSLLLLAGAGGVLVARRRAVGGIAE